MTPERIDELERLHLAWELARNSAARPRAMSRLALRDALLEDAPALFAAAREAARLRAALEPFARYAAVLELLADRDRSLGSTNGWSDVDPVLGALGQVLTMGDFRRAAAALAEGTEVANG